MIRRNLAWILFGLSLVLNVFFVGGFVYARYFGPPWGAHAGPWQSQRIDARWTEDLDLDATQQRTMRDAFRAMRQRNADRVRELMQLRRQLVSELRKDRLDPAAVDPLLDRTAQLRAEIQKDGLRTADQFAATLRPEQRDRFREKVIARAMAFHAPGSRGGMRNRPPEDRKPQ
jgi:uncharacterized membrane protein